MHLFGLTEKYLDHRAVSTVFLPSVLGLNWTHIAPNSFRQGVTIGRMKRPK